MINLVIAFILLITGLNMPYLRYKVDLALDSGTPQYLIDKLDKTLYELNDYGVIINEGEANEEQTKTANHHICNHDIGGLCDTSEDVTMPEIAIGYTLAGSDSPDVIKGQVNDVCNGADDQIKINEALNTYGSVQLIGSFSTSDSIVMDSVYDNIKLIGGSSITFDTANPIKPIIKMGANKLSITSDSMAIIGYSLQPAVDSGAYGIQVIDACGHCTLTNLRIYNCNYGFKCHYNNAPYAAMWNSVFTNIYVNSCNQGNWQHVNYSASGNVFNNLYLNNNGQDEEANGFKPRLLEYSGGTTVVFNQLNLEWTDNIEQTAMSIHAIEQCVINGMHWEGLTLETYDTFYYCGRYGGTLSINGWTIDNCKIQDESGGVIGFSSLVMSDNTPTGQGNIIIEGFNIRPNCDFTGADGLYLIDDRGDTPTKIWCRACPDSSTFTDIVRVADSGTGESGLKEYN